jgi:hypothetical protein
MAVPSSRLSFAETLSMVLESREAALAKALPGTVVSYASGKADVRPGVHRRVRSEDDDNEDEIEILPVIPDVPVMWPQGRGFSFIGSLNPGDPVLLICCDRDITGWLASGVPSAPEDARSHSWSSAVAIPGLVHNAYTNAPADALALASKLDQIFQSLAPPSVVAATNPAQTMALVNLILAKIQAVYSTPISTVASSIAKVSS